MTRQKMDIIFFYLIYFNYDVKCKISRQTMYSLASDLRAILFCFIVLFTKLIIQFFYTILDPQICTSRSFRNNALLWWRKRNIFCFSKVNKSKRKDFRGGGGGSFLTGFFNSDFEIKVLSIKFRKFLNSQTNPVHTILPICMNVFINSFQLKIYLTI